MNFKIKKLKSIRLYHLLAVLAAGIALMLVSNLFAGITTENKNDAKETVEADTDKNIPELESRLAAIVGKIEGVSNVSVLITYENSGVKKHGIDSKEDVTSSGDTTSVKKESTAVMNKESSHEEPFITEEVMPQIRGVLIVAKGVNSSFVKSEIADAVSAVLGVAVHKVKVLSAD